jgi:hypothetical protein
MLGPFVEAICFPQTWQSAVCLSWETVFSYVVSYRAPQWGHLNVSAISQIYARQVSTSRYFPGLYSIEDKELGTNERRVTGSAATMASRQGREPVMFVMYAGLPPQVVKREVNSSCRKQSASLSPRTVKWLTSSSTSLLVRASAMAVTTVRCSSVGCHGGGVRCVRFRSLRPKQLRAAAEENDVLVPAAAQLQSRYSCIKCPVRLFHGVRRARTDTPAAPRTAPLSAAYRPRCGSHGALALCRPGRCSGY